MTDLKSILSSFKKEIKEILGKNFQELILFGSNARDEESSESDIDLLVVLKKEKKEKRNIGRVLEILSLNVT
jgi:predicted nucleotidyltransferase